MFFFPKTFSILPTPLKLIPKHMYSTHEYSAEKLCGRKSHLLRIIKLKKRKSFNENQTHNVDSNDMINPPHNFDMKCCLRNKIVFGFKSCEMSFEWKFIY